MHATPGGAAAPRDVTWDAALTSGVMPLAPLLKTPNAAARRRQKILCTQAVGVGAVVWMTATDCRECITQRVANGFAVPPPQEAVRPADKCRRRPPFADRATRRPPGRLRR